LDGCKPKIIKIRILSMKRVDKCSGFFTFIRYESQRVQNNDYYSLDIYL
jgi:hypothetical protein